MAIPVLRITKNWLTDTLVQEANWDNIKNPVFRWSQYIRANFYQISRDTFGTSYDYNNDGVQTYVPCLADRIAGGSYKSALFQSLEFKTSGLIKWDSGAGTVVIPTGGLTMTWRAGDDLVTNILPAGTYTLADTYSLIFVPHTTTGTTISLAAAYASIAMGEYAIVAPANLNLDALAAEIILFRRVGSVLEIPSLNRSIQSGGYLTTSNLLAHSHASDNDGGTLTWDNIFGTVPFVGNHSHKKSGSVYSPAYLTGGNSATSTIATWNAVTNGTFNITINGVLRAITALDFSAATHMNDVALIIQDEIRAVTASTETVEWVTNHFVIRSANTTVASAITVASATGGGTDISGAGATNFLDCDVGNGVVTNASLADFEGGNLNWDDVWADAKHSHASDAEGSVLTWDNALAAAGNGDHNHSGNTEGGTLTWDNIFSVASAGNHDHSSDTEGGALDFTEAGVAESITQLWDFTVGAQIGNLKIISDRIVETDTDADTGVIRLNYYGYEDGITRFRDLSIYDGKASSILGIDGGTKSIYVNQSDGYLYTRAIDPPISGTTIAGNVIPRNSLITANSLAKAWVIFSTDSTPTPTILNSYNVDTVTWNAGDDDFTITFDANFANANYVVVGSTGKNSGTLPNYDAGIFTVGLRGVGSCLVSARNTDNTGNTCDERDFYVAFYGDLAT